MTKLELAKKVAAKTELTITKAAEVINDTILQIERALMSGDHVNLMGFATIRTMVTKGHVASGLKTIKNKNLPDYVRIQVKISPTLKKNVKKKYKIKGGIKQCA